MDKVKLTKEEFETLYEIEESKKYATDTSEDKIEDTKDLPGDQGGKKEEEKLLTDEEEAQDKALEETLGWDTEIEE